MKLPIRNYLDVPLTIFIEPSCQQYEIPVGGRAEITLEPGAPHSMEVHPEAWISIWNEGSSAATVEIFSTHGFEREIGSSD